MFDPGTIWCDKNGGNRPEITPLQSVPSDQFFGRLTQKGAYLKSERPDKFAQDTFFNNSFPWPLFIPCKGIKNWNCHRFGIYYDLIHLVTNMLFEEKEKGQMFYN
jgi:hypothetical protein